ncbi:MAG TPA: hypothetical protein VFA04_23035 [Bryobacteraceae bacterium]|nr:hypothetical protein [Bryobacteraceae bacterium]
MDPVAAYTTRQQQWRDEAARSERRFITIGNWRLLTALSAVIIAALAFWRGVLSAWWLLFPLAVFIALVVWHEHVVRRRDFAARAVRYYDDRLARLTNRWAGTGQSGDAFRDPAHVYADDLDIFGRGSLFELVSTARTGAGERTLAQWLLAPAPRDEALSRQESIRELCSRLDLREDLALLGEDIRAEVHAEMLDAWGSVPPVPLPNALRWVALALSLAGVLTFSLFMAHVLRLWPFAGVFGCDVIFLAVVRRRVRLVIGAADTPAHDLRILSLLLARLERERFQAGRLHALRSELDIEGLPASRRIARLERWTEFLDSSDHLLVRLIEPVVLWREQIAMAMESWRRRNGRHLGRWLAVVGELEALSSLASLAFERPSWTWPDLLESSNPCFAAEGLQHPLMPPSQCVPNDVSIGEQIRVLIVSGSNMSGKSTLLRAIGLNTVLAWAGAPVAAQQLRVSLLQTGASIRVVDSLQDGRSRFYAEITRMRQIMELAGNGRPVLFLLDELMSGTNSHDRRIGAAAVVRGLVDRGAIGLITTHDLALADLDRDLNGRAANVHFDDEITDGQIRFDYRLRPGVVTRSNALELMRAVGLHV